MAQGKGDRSLNIGFVSTRFRGLDGVSLESAKWATVLKEFGHHSFWFAGELDRDPAVCMLVPEAFFGHPGALSLNKALFSRQQQRSRKTTDTLHQLKELLKDKLYAFVESFHIDLLIAENALAIPMHDPGLRSLNLSTAVAVAAFEVLRQRR